MKEIKFRAWDIQTKSMYDNPVLIVDKKTNCYKVGCYDRKCGVYMIYDDILMQFTGLYDKNGDPIYEGDICRRYHPFEYPLFQICRYEKGCFYLGKSSFEELFIQNDFAICVEIIGNIYENPDLLGDKK